MPLTMVSSPHKSDYARGQGDGPRIVQRLDISRFLVQQSHPHPRFRPMHPLSEANAYVAKSLMSIVETTKSALV